MENGAARLERVRETVEAVARFHETEHLVASPFHLCKCGGCGAPAYQQPCNLCGFYPRGADKGYWNPKNATREDFARMVEGSGPGGRDGTIATWHARAYWENRAGLTRENARSAGEAAAMKALAVSCCSVDDVWEAVAVEGAMAARDTPPVHVANGWNGVYEARAVAEGWLGTPGNPASAAAIRHGAAQWARAVHQDDAEGMAEALAAVLDAAGTMGRAIGRNGNLVYAIDCLKRAQDSLGTSAPAIKA